MTLGEKLKQARLEAQLSQRQLCGDTITRNMLSQIENGTAKPSYTTLQILSRRLGKPVSYFLEDAPSSNQGILQKAQALPPREALSVLEEYLQPDPALDAWYRLLLTDCCLQLAQQAIGENRKSMAGQYLDRAEENLRQLPRFGELYQSRLVLLRYAVEGKTVLAKQLPDNTPEQLLRAGWALEEGKPELCLALLDGSQNRPEPWYLLRADALMAMGRWQEAVQQLLGLEENPPVMARLEQCYRELRDFEKAYYYACKQRNIT